MENPRTFAITGASSGIGRALAFACAARGYHVGLAARRVTALEALADQIRAAHPQIRVAVAALDVDDTDGVAPALNGLFTELGGIDIVVVNAGINELTRVGTDDLARELAIVHTNLQGAIATVHAATVHFKERGGGHLVGVASLAARSPIPQQAAYCASKAALRMYLDVARKELGRFDIAVTTILAGFVKTEIVDDMERFPFVVTAEQAAGEMIRAIEARRPEAIVPAFPWRLAAPAITGLRHLERLAPRRRR